ncbi:MAG: hypothetical protein QG602_12, partial [Verrucomicrobiota bacterium]|nr:hypothetical protein [Verrucomicrobiota bacterium]
LCLLLSLLAPVRAARPNVQLILVDDLKPTLGCYGDAKAVTPNLDRFARSAVRFDRAYTNQAVCAPARNALLVGMRPTSIGVYDLVTNFRLGAPAAVTLQQAFRQGGYRVETFGKVFHGGNGDESDRAALSAPHWDWQDKKLYAADHQDRPATENLDVPDNAYSDGAMTDAILERLRQVQGGGEPFLLVAGFKKPHLPFTAPRKYWELHERTEFAPDGPAAPPQHAPNFAGHNWGELRNFSDIPDVGPVDATKASELIRGYYAATSYSDAQIGRLLDRLNELKLDENTIVIVWGDHGWHLGDHGWWCKHTNYEQANRIPLLVRAPGVSAPGASTAAFIESIDILPTLCELTGLATPSSAEGVSQVAVLRDPQQAVRSEAMHVYPRGANIGRAVRTARHRLIEWKAAGADAATAVIELYDYQTDPQETVNIAAQQPEVVAALRARLALLPEARLQIRDNVQQAKREQRKENRQGTSQKNP